MITVIQESIVNALIGEIWSNECSLSFNHAKKGRINTISYSPAHPLVDFKGTSNLYIYKYENVCVCVFAFFSAIS